MTMPPSNPSQSTSPPQVPGQHKSWLATNWKWLLVVVFLCGAVFVGGMITLVMGVMRGSDVVKEAVARAQSNADVMQRLGAPISEGHFVSGSINVSGGSGDANVSVPISGPKGSATVYATAQKSEGTWTYSVMQAAIDGSAERIDLLASTASATLPPAAPVATPAVTPAAAPPSSTTSAGTVAATTPPAGAAIQSAGPVPGGLGTADGEQTGSKVVIDELKRGTSTVTLKFTIYNNSNAELSTGSRFNSTDYKGFRNFSAVHLIDDASKKKYFVVADNDGNCACSESVSDIAPKAQVSLWAKFPAPPDNVQKITVEIPHFIPIDDVPIR